ncbi:WD40-repeat-containing domain protein [Mycena amicta]|nr:WD40-repeat-containing domain protein [Mycena amicta]
MYSLLIESADKVSWTPGLYHRKRPNLHVEIDQGGGRVVHTPTRKRELAPRWDFAAALAPETASNTAIALRLYHDTSFPGRSPAFLGECKTTVHELLEGEPVELDMKTKNHLSARLSVRLSRSTPSTPRNSTDMERQRTTTQESVTPSRTSRRIPSRTLTRGRVSLDLPSPTAERASQVITAPPASAGTLVEALGNAVANLERLVRTTEGSSERAKLHLYVHLAWKLLSSLSLAEKTNTRVSGQGHATTLARTIAQAYASTGSGLLNKINSSPVCAGIMLRMAQQTAEAAIFLRMYLQQGDDSTVDQQRRTAKAEELAQAIGQLKSAFDAGVEREEIIFVSAQRATRPSEDDFKLLNATLVHSAQFIPEHEHPSCLPGTRQDLLSEITSWLFASSQTQNVFCLNGVSGAGKTTVALTLASFFQSLHHLGACVVLQRDNVAGCSARAVVHNIAFQLAHRVPGVFEALREALEESVLAAPIRTQFRKLIVEPLVRTQGLCGPIVFVLDGLDECVDPRAKELLISLVAEEFAALPSSVRVLVTCNSQISAQGSLTRLQSASHIISRSLDLNSDSARRDILTYLRHSLAHTRRTKGITNPSWPSDSTFQMLADYSNGSFAWATIAGRFVHHTYDPKKRLSILLAPANKTERSLDGLFRTVLMHSVDWKDPVTAADAGRVLNVLGLAQMPLTETMLNALLGLADGRVASVLRVLTSFIDWAPEKPARFVHPSLADFLATSSRPRDTDPWRVQSGVGHQMLALGCLRVLNAQLRFNICRLMSSNILNSDIVDLPTRIHSNISLELSYAVRFWAHHLSGAMPCSELVEELTTFFSRSLLFWLEALSVLGHVGIAHGAVSVALEHVRQHAEYLVDLVHDTLRFISSFGTLIAQSAPHLYISALPFAPQQSLLKKTYSPSFPRVLRYSGPLAEHWPTLRRVFRGHLRGVTCVAFSPDGKHIASGSWDNTVHIRDAEKGTLIVEPLVGHTNGICSLAYSSDGRWLVTGSADRTVRLWNAQSGGAAIGSPLVGHTEGVTSVAFSLSGRRVVSGSYDRSARVWDTETGVLVAGPFEGHSGSVHAVAFSPDGRRIVTASTDKTARVWSVGSTAVVTVFKKHSHWVNAVAFSPDGSLIVSGSNDHTLYVWDPDTGAVVVGPVTGHKQAVSSVVFSPDAARILTGSTDGTVRVWNALDGTPVAGPFEGHTGTVSSVAFSPDGMQCASASDDCTVRVWEVPATQTKSSNPIYSGPITSVRYSPNGQHIVAGCADQSVLVWNSSTGMLAAGPLQGHLGKVTAVSFSPDGTHIASTSSDETIRIWTFSTGKLARVLKGHKKAVTSLAYSPDGLRLVSGSQDRSVRLWDLTTDNVKSVRQLKVHTDWVSCVAFSPTGNQIATGSDDQTVCIVDSNTGTLVAGPLKHRNVVTCVAFSPDGKTLVSASRGNTLRLWDSASGALLLGPIEGHSDWVNAVAFSPDGKYVVSGSDDRTVRVWDSKTGDLVAGPFVGHAGWVRSVAFSPDGKRIVSGSEDKTVRVWRLELDSSKQKSHIQPNNLPQTSLHWGPRPQLQARWILDSAAERILCIPSWLKDDFCYPWNDFVIRPDGLDQLGLEQFVCGEEWTKCFKESQI